MVCPKDCTSAHIDCVCARKFKIPKQDISFIKDQRKKVGHNSGKMIIYGSKKVVAQELSQRSKNEEYQSLESKQSDTYSEEDDPEREPLDLEEQDDPMYVPEKESYSNVVASKRLLSTLSKCIDFLGLPLNANQNSQQVLLTSSTK